MQHIQNQLIKKPIKRKSNRKKKKHRFLKDLERTSKQIEIPIPIGIAVIANRTLKGSIRKLYYQTFFVEKRGKKPEIKIVSSYESETIMLTPNEFIKNYLENFYLSHLYVVFVAKENSYEKVLTPHTSKVLPYFSNLLAELEKDFSKNKIKDFLFQTYELYPRLLEKLFSSSILEKYSEIEKAYTNRLYEQVKEEIEKIKPKDKRERETIEYVEDYIKNYVKRKPIPLLLYLFRG